MCRQVGMLGQAASCNARCASVTGTGDKQVMLPGLHSLHLVVSRYPAHSRTPGVATVNHSALASISVPAGTLHTATGCQQHVMHMSRSSIRHPSMGCRSWLCHAIVPPCHANITQQRLTSFRLHLSAAWSSRGCGACLLHSPLLRAPGRWNLLGGGSGHRAHTTIPSARPQKAGIASPQPAPAAPGDRAYRECGDRCSVPGGARRCAGAGQGRGTGQLQSAYGPEASAACSPTSRRGHWGKYGCFGGRYAPARCEERCMSVTRQAACVCILQRDSLGLSPEAGKTLASAVLMAREVLKGGSSAVSVAIPQQAQPQPAW